MKKLIWALISCSMFGIVFTVYADQADISKSATVSLTCKNYGGDAFTFDLKLPALLVEGGYPVADFESRYAIDRVADNNGTAALLQALKLVAQDFVSSQEGSSTPVYFGLSSESDYYNGAPGPDFHKYIAGYSGEFRTKSIPSPVDLNAFLFSVKDVLKVAANGTQMIWLNHDVMTGTRRYGMSDEPVICKFGNY